MSKFRETRAPKGPRMNRGIRVPEVLLIDQDEVKVGIVPTAEALQRAQQAGMDLVEVVATARPPVCRIMNYGKFRFEQTKREKESKKGRVQHKVKEIQLKPNIEKNDFDIKCNRARGFLEKGFKVKLSCRFRGRENARPEFGFELLKKFCSNLEDVGACETEMKKMGRILTMVVAPISKKGAKPTQSKPEEN